MSSSFNMPRGSHDVPPISTVSSPSGGGIVDHRRNAAGVSSTTNNPDNPSQRFVNSSSGGTTQTPTTTPSMPSPSKMRSSFPPSSPENHTNSVGSQPSVSIVLPSLDGRPNSSPTTQPTTETPQHVDQHSEPELRGLPSNPTPSQPRRPDSARGSPNNFQPPMNSHFSRLLSQFSAQPISSSSSSSSMVGHREASGLATSSLNWLSAPRKSKASSSGARSPSRSASQSSSAPGGASRSASVSA